MNEDDSMIKKFFILFFFALSIFFPTVSYAEINNDIIPKWEYRTLHRLLNILLVSPTSSLKKFSFLDPQQTKSLTSPSRYYFMIYNYNIYQI